MRRFDFALAALIALFIAPWNVAAQGLPLDQLEKIKAATVYIKIIIGEPVSSGSGFVVHSTANSGIIVTNHHVISSSRERERGRPQLPFPPRPRPVGPQTIEVVFHSGDKKLEWSVKADVLATDQTNDLAVLQVKALKTIPAPLSLDGPEKVPETTPVYVCGFPFGDLLSIGDKNPEISIGQATVSSNRKDELGDITSVQLNGALNPGNSGGPVLTADGKLVGVAVKTVVGAGIGMAIPVRLVKRILGTSHQSSSAMWNEAGAATAMRVVSKLQNPLGRLNAMQAVMAPLRDATPPQDVAKLAGATEAVPTFLPEPTVEAITMVPDTITKPFWFQLKWQDLEGAWHTLPAVRMLNVSGVQPQRLPRNDAPRNDPPLANDGGFTGRGQSPNPPPMNYPPAAGGTVGGVLLNPPRKISPSLERNRYSRFALTNYSGTTYTYKMIVVGTKPAQDVPEGVTDVVQLDFQDLTEHAPTEVQLLVKSDFAERMKFAMRSDGRPKVPAEVVFQITRHMREKNCSLATVVSVTFLDSTLSQQSWSQNADAVTPAPAPVRAAVPPPPANPAAGLPNATPNPAPVNPNPAPMNPVANAAPNPAPNAVAAPPAPNSASESQDGDNTLLYAIGGTVLGVGVLGVIAAIVMSSKPKKSNRTSRTNRNGPRVARRVREDEDDDDDDDDRPRRAKRVRD